MKFSVPASVTVTGWILVQAESLEAAKTEAARLNDVGISLEALNDADESSEVHADEIETLGEDGEASQCRVEALHGLGVFDDDAVSLAEAEDIASGCERCIADAPHVAAEGGQS